MKSQSTFWFSWAVLMSLGLLGSCQDGSNPSGSGTRATTGRLRMPDGIPAASARVALVPVDFVPAPGDSTAPFEALADGEGAFAFADIPPGKYNLLASKGTQKSFRGPLILAAGGELGEDTLRHTGSLTGTIQLQPGDDPRTVFILLLGTPHLATPEDESGIFRLSGLAEGEYRVRFLSTISDYVPLDTVLRIHSGTDDTLPQPIRPIFAGAPAVRSLEAAWDSLLLVTRLHWSPADPAPAGYNLYRTRVGTPFGTIPFNTSPLQDTAFTDSVFLDITIRPGDRFIYAVKAVDANGNASGVFSPLDTVTIVTSYRAPREFTLEPRLSLTQFEYNQGELFILSSLIQPEVLVYDTAGTKLRSFRTVDSSVNFSYGYALRVLEDTVYVMDEPRRTRGTMFRRLIRSGEFLDSIVVTGMPNQRHFSRFWVSPEGRIVSLGDSVVYSASPEGILDSAPSPIRGLSVSRRGVEPLGESLLFMQWVDHRARAEFVLLRPVDLTVVRHDTTSLSRPLERFATNGRDRIWILYDGYVEVLDADFRVLRRAAFLPHGGVDIAVDGSGNVYIASNRSILILDAL